MKQFKSKVLSAILSLFLISLIIFGCARIQTSTTTQIEPNDKDIVVLFTNDVHCGVDDNIGYAGLSNYKNQMLDEGNYVALIDAGDFSQGAPIGTLSKGKFLVDIIKQVGYDMVIPGNHEFDYNMENFLSNCYDLNNIIFCSNFIDLRTNQPVLNPYKIMTFGNKKIAFVGATTPESFTKSTPKYFQDENGNYIYSLSEDNNGLALYKSIQTAVDDARSEGVDYVILVGHLGIDGTTDRWKSTEVIKNTTGIDMVIDGHSHETFVNSVKNKNGKEITLAQTGTKLQNIGKLTISTDGTFNAEIIPKEAVSIMDGEGKLNVIKDQKIDAYIKNIQSQFSNLLTEIIVPDNQIDLVTHDAKTEERLVRKQETNLGDLCADAYRYVLDADIGFMNGGGVRKPLLKGNITYNDCLTVMPFNNMATLIRCKGSVVKDALELGASKLPEENGGFIQVSGLTYTIDTTKPSAVLLDEKGNFVKVDGEYRVSDIKVGGEDLDIDKDYTVACHDYMLMNGGDGFTMFVGSEVLKDRIMPDVDVLVDYLKAEGTSNYSNPNGEGRITIK